MKTNNAIKKLEKTGFTVTISAGFIPVKLVIFDKLGTA